MSPKTRRRLAKGDSLPPAVAPAAGVVAQLLAESRQHHAEKNTLANRKVNGHPAPDYTGAEAAIALALQTRLQAHALDPQHLDPAWSLDRAKHEDLVAFYALYPSID